MLIWVMVVGFGVLLVIEVRGQFELRVGLGE
jgi:hypothetical protein